MAIFKKSFKSSTGNRVLPSELIEVRGYDEAANEIDAIRLSTGEAIRVGFLEREKAGNFARPEVKHFIGKIRKPRDMSSPPGSVLLIDRNIERDGKLYTSWATAWVRRPEEESVIKGSASITFLAEKPGKREDGTKGYKGLLTVVVDDNFAGTNDSKLAGEHPIIKGAKAVLADSDQAARDAAIALIEKGVSAGIRVRAGTEVASHCIFARYQEDPAKLVNEFFNEIDEDTRALIGKDVDLEIIPVISLQIGNDTAAALYTGMTSDGKENKSAAAIRRRFLGSVLSKEGEQRDVPAFTNTLALLRVRHAANGAPYFSVENLHPQYSAKPILGTSNAILSAATPNSARFVMQAAQEAQNAPAAAAPAAPAAAAPAPAKAAEPAPVAQAAAPAAAAQASNEGVDFSDDDGFTFGDNEGEMNEDELRSIFGDMDDAPRATGPKM